MGREHRQRRSVGIEQRRGEPAVHRREFVCFDHAGPSADDGKAKGLDRADQAAGEHGKQGRDNAREKQAR